MKHLRIIFMGTPDFAVPSLEALLQHGCNIVGVITSPDRPAGRGQKITASPVKQFALEKGLRILQPANLKSPEFLEELKSLKADLQIVVAFRMLPESVWAMPKFGTFNLHASLLPDYRGAAPINWAIINGERTTGITTFFLNQEIDAGAILFQESIDIGIHETAGVLHDRMMVKGAALVLKTVDAIASGNLTPVEQSHLLNGRQPKSAPKLNKDNISINWNNAATQIFNFIRGLSPYPAAHATIKNMQSQQLITCKIYAASMVERSVSKTPGSIETDGKNHLIVNCGEESLSIHEIQIAGKQRMKVKDLLNGFRIDENWQFI